MCDYPKSLPEFQKIFPDDDTCANWLFEMRWPDGFECPACGHKVCYALKTRKWLYECKGNYMRKCAIGGQSLANAERGVGMSGFAGKIGD